MIQKPLSNNSLILMDATQDNILKAAEMLLKDKLVAFPTETVYGLGGLAESSKAIAAIYQTKGRPSHNPLIVHVTGKEMAKRYAYVDGRAEMLIDAFWPAPLTLILPVKKGSLSDLVIAGGDTVALRSPNHPVAIALLQAVGEGVAAPSANRSGRISPTNPAHVMQEFQGRAGALAMVLNGGSSSVGLESTVLDCTQDKVRILRYGSIDRQQLELFLPVYHMQEKEPSATILKSPGLLTSHYAPDTPVRLNAIAVEKDEGLLAFGDVPEQMKASVILNLSPSGDLEEAAAHLYDYLRRMDDRNVRCVAVMPIPEIGIGCAINDRLRRAAAKRD